jgi:metal-responsive CopG/Arc/MetJ family transcriptional regulator
MTKRMKEGRRRVTLSLPAYLVKGIDHRAKASGSTRSSVVERLLETAREKESQAQVALEARDYYQRMTPAERAEYLAEVRAFSGAWRRQKR